MLFKSISQIKSLFHFTDRFRCVARIVFFERITTGKEQSQSYTKRTISRNVATSTINSLCKRHWGSFNGWFFGFDEFNNTFSSLQSTEDSSSWSFQSRSQFTEIVRNMNAFFSFRFVHLITRSLSRHFYFLFLILLIEFLDKCAKLQVP